MMDLDKFFKRVIIAVAGRGNKELLDQLQEEFRKCNGLPKLEIATKIFEEHQKIQQEWISKVSKDIRDYITAPSKGPFRGSYEP